MGRRTHSPRCPSLLSTTHQAVATHTLGTSVLVDFFIEAPSFLSKGEITLFFSLKNYTEGAIAVHLSLTQRRAWLKQLKI